MSTENFRERLQERASTIYRKMDEIVTESDAPNEVRELKLTRPEKVAFAAAEILGETSIATLGVKRQDEILRRDELVRGSKAYESGSKKVNKLIKIIQNG